jgi:hypothetical protein
VEEVLPICAARCVVQSIARITNGIAGMAHYGFRYAAQDPAFDTGFAAAKNFLHFMWNSF